MIDRRRLLIGAGALAAAPAFGQEPASELQVRVENKSVPELCAEKDNIELDFVSSRVRGLQIQAVHPSYINTIVTDRWAPVWSSCNLSHDPKFVAQAPRRHTFWETADFWLTGITFPNFWRPNEVPIHVGGQVEQGLHLIQLWMWYRERAEEILAFYPPDGYWRARPLPFEEMRLTAYGSSFLVGPVETQGRPMVDLQGVVFDPSSRTFTLRFKRGGAARLSLKGVDQERLTLDVSFDEAMPGGRPFASLRSMYAMETMNDAAIVAWRSMRGKGWEEAPVIDFPGADAAEVWIGRRLPSRHNLSAPDMIFGKFQGVSS
jgi:hypothetical protein